MDLRLTTASGAVLDLDFEPLRSLAADPKTFIPTILAEINCGYFGVRSIYHDMVQPGDVVIDLGANVGLVSLYAATVASRVVAVEASPRNLFALAQVLHHFDAAGLVHNIEPVHAAVWTRDGQVAFGAEPANSTMDRIDFGAECFGRERRAEWTVPAVTLPTLMDRCGVERAGWVKMDVEGAELDILASESFARAAPRIDRLWCECHNYKDGRDGTELAHEVRKTLEKHFPVIEGFTARGMLARR